MGLPTVATSRLLSRWHRRLFIVLVVVAISFLCLCVLQELRGVVVVVDVHSVRGFARLGLGVPFVSLGDSFAFKDLFKLFCNLDVSGVTKLCFDLFEVHM